MDTSTDKPSINTNPFSRCFNGLDLLFKHNQPMALILLAVSVIGGAAQFINRWTPDKSGPPESLTLSGEPINVGLALAVLLPIVLLVLIVVVVLSTYFNGIANFVAWKTSLGETTTFGESIREVTRRFWTLLAVQFLIFFKVFGGFLLLVIPGIRAALRYQMVYFAIFDENLKAKQAMKRIKTLTKNHLMEVFGIATVASIIPIIGLLLSMGGEAVFYPELKAAAESKEPYPKVHWLNYIGFILVGLFVLFIAGILMLVMQFGTSK
jgi:hypothetical protein